MTANGSQPQQKPSNVVPMSTRPSQTPAPSKTPPAGTLTPIENHPPDEPGYGHGV